MVVLDFCSNCITGKIVNIHYFLFVYVNIAFVANEIFSNFTRELEIVCF